MRWHHTKGENMDLCACGYVSNDLDVIDFFSVLTIITPILIEIGGDIFPTL